MKTLLCCLIALSIFAGAAASPAQINSKDNQVARRETQVRDAIAGKRFRRVVVQLKNGSTVSGVITSVSEDEFSITLLRELTGPGPVETIRYSDVATLLERPQGLKVLKRIGTTAAFLPLALLSLPVCQVSILLKHPVLCPCYSGLP